MRKVKRKEYSYAEYYTAKETNLQLWIVISIAVTLMSEYRIHDSVLIFSSTYTKHIHEGTNAGVSSNEKEWDQRKGK